MNFYISMDKYVDADLMLLVQIFEMGREIIMKGGKVVFQREYINAPTEVVAVFETEDDLKNWKLRLNKIYPEIQI